MKEYISYRKYGKLLTELVNKIKKRDISHIQILYAPPRGGLPIAIHLSHYLKLPIIYNVKDLDKKIQFNKAMFIDDIVDTGATLNKLDEDYSFDLSCSLFYKKNSIIEPDIWVEETDKWIVFPWERIDEKPNRIGYNI